MKRLANHEEAIKNFKALLNDQISIDMLYERLDEALTDLTKYRLTDGDFIGCSDGFNAIHAIMMIKGILTTENKSLSKAS